MAGRGASEVVSTTSVLQGISEDFVALECSLMCRKVRAEALGREASTSPGRDDCD